MVSFAKYNSTKSIIQDVIERHNPMAFFVGFSGGDDSLVTCHVVKDIIPEAKILHINTGIGIEKTRQYVRDYCDEMGWELVEVRAKEDCGQDYDELVVEQGFPGPAMHTKMYNRLKERCVEHLLRVTKKSYWDKIAIFTGIRHDESSRRARYTGSIIDQRGAAIWVNPLYHWTSDDMYGYREEHNLRRNPVSEILGMSGECLCGAYAQKGELASIRLIEPETADRIEALTKRVWDAGWKWSWEDQPSKYLIREKHGQQNLFQPLCVGCNKKGYKMEQKDD